eukprot:3770694-Amphidinium_carterae.1
MRLQEKEAAEGVAPVEALLARLKENPATKTAGVPPRPPRPPSAEGRLQAECEQQIKKKALPTRTPQQIHI